MKPFLKWAGSKYQIINPICKVLPKGVRLIEPFAGSGAVFLNTQFPSYLLTERNADLIQLYQTLQKEGQSFIDYCESFFTKKNNSKRIFYKFRETFNQTTENHLKSALFIYLNRHGYNGLCRYNLSGKFNVPYGYYESPYFPEKEMLYFYQRAKYADFRCCDYRAILKEIREGDVVYCDPPYVPLSGTANFTQYGPYPFKLNDQKELADFAKQLTTKGIPVLISNHNTRYIKELYKGATFIKLKVRRYIGCKVSSRKKISEILALFQPS